MEPAKLSTRLSSKGQVIIPKSVRTHYHWEAGQELMVMDTDEGILLKARKPFDETRLADAAGVLKYSGKAKTLEDMSAAIRKGVERHDRR